MKSPSPSGLAPLPCLATMLVAAAFTWANLGGSNLSPLCREYGFPLTYRKHLIPSLGVDEFYPGALGFDVVIAVASTFVTTGRWSGLIGRYQRLTVRGLVATVAIFAVILAVWIASPLHALLMLLGCLAYGPSSTLHVIILITFHHRTRPQAASSHPSRRDDDS